VIGILAAQLVNWMIAEPVPKGASAQEILMSWNGQTGWRWMFGVTAVPALLFFVGSLLIPESPRWLAKSGRIAEAKKVLSKIYPVSGADAVLSEVQSTLGADDEKVDWSALRDPKVVVILTLGIGLAIFQQWCGINVIFNYAEEIFSGAGYSVSDILFNIVITGSVNVAASVAALFLVDRWGRRPLMLFGAASLCVIYIALGACYAMHVKGVAVLVLVLLAIAAYAVSLAPVVWVVISEIFPNRIRGVAMSIAVGALWIACFILTFTFPLLNQALGAAGTFWIYAAICAVGFFFTYARLPETKGKTLEEIETLFNAR
jgi:sugar porter (SP) family MFS transporter